MGICHLCAQQLCKSFPHSCVVYNMFRMIMGYLSILNLRVIMCCSGSSTCHYLKQSSSGCRVSVRFCALFARHACCFGHVGLDLTLSQLAYISGASFESACDQAFFIKHASEDRCFD